MPAPPILPKRSTLTHTIGLSSHVRKKVANTILLIVEVFPRVWVQQNVRFDADRTRLGGSGESIKLEILCPNLRLASLEKAAVALEPAQKVVAAAITKEGEMQEMSAFVRREAAG